MNEQKNIFKDIQNGERCIQNSFDDWYTPKKIIHWIYVRAEKVHKKCWRNDEIDDLVPRISDNNQKLEIL